MSEKIDVPQSAYQVKADFPEHPSDALVEEILAFISKTGEPWMWWGHTHTKIPDGDVPVFVWDFRVPEFGRKRLAIAPCPHCCPTAPRYKHGVIAYFPKEKAIRLMGMDCFAATNPEAFEVAKRTMKSFQRSVRDRRYLERRLPILGDLIHAASAARPQAEAIDRFRHDLSMDVPQLVRFTLQRAIFGGELRVREKVKEATFSREGKVGERETEQLRTWSRITGASMLMADKSSLAERLRNVTARLLDVQARYNAHPTLDNMPAAERGTLVRAFQRGENALRDLYKDIADQQQFARGGNIETLERWSAHEAAEVQVFIEKDPQGIRIGKTRETSRLITIPHAAKWTLLPLPEMG